MGPTLSLLVTTESLPSVTTARDPLMLSPQSWLEPAESCLPLPLSSTTLPSFLWPTLLTPSLMPAMLLTPSHITVSPFLLPQLLLLKKPLSLRGRREKLIPRFCLVVLFPTLVSPTLLLQLPSPLLELWPSQSWLSQMLLLLLKLAMK